MITVASLITPNFNKQINSIPISRFINYDIFSISNDHKKIIPNSG